MSAETELAWAAGFFDGEGCTTYCVNSHRENVTYYKLYMIVGQHYSPETLNRFRAAVDGGKVYGPYRTKAGATRWQWVASRREARLVIDRLLPYLCSVKIEQALGALEKDRQWRFAGIQEAA